MPKHVFFDLDNTLTPSKSLILPEHLPILIRLSDRADIIIVSGHGEKDIRIHLTGEMSGRMHMLGQNGNFAETKEGRLLWNRSLPHEKKDVILAFIAKARAHLHYTVRDETDIIDDRDSQLAFSLIGHHEDRDIKNAFDPDFAKRKKLLQDMENDVRELEQKGVEVRIGGTTVLDFFELGKNKGHNVALFIETMGWNKDDAMYLGDALFPGGNDETVIGVIATHAVAGPGETFRFIEENLLSY